MMRRLLVQAPLSAILLLVCGCKHAKHLDEEYLWSAPPVVSNVLLVSDVGHGEEHDHAATASAPAEIGPVDMHVGLSHPFFTKSSPKRLILKVDIAGTARAPQSRRPLNLALVIDRSGSMAEDDKFMYAMEAARLVVENLSARDVISLIAFNDTATVLSPAGPAVNPEYLSYRLGQFGPEGRTNLSAALLEAFAQIDVASVEGQRRQIIVLTDGLANRGITEPAKLEALVSAAKARGIGLSTLGCGVKFDEKLLTKLAGAGGGRYTYVRSSERIPTAIAAELDGMLEVVAQNVRLDIRVRPPARITRVYGRLLDQPVSTYSFDLGDLRVDEQGVFVVEVDPHGSESGATVGIDATLTLDNPGTAARERLLRHAEAVFSEDIAQIRGSENKSVLTYASVLDALERAEEAIQGLDVERFREARRMFDRLYDKAHQYAIDSRDQQLLNQTFLLRHFMAELSAARENKLMHDHHDAERQLTKEVDYRRYLLEHHRRQ